MKFKIFEKNTSVLFFWALLTNCNKKYIRLACGADRRRRQKIFEILIIFMHFQGNFSFFSISGKFYVGPNFIAFLNSNFLALRTLVGGLTPPLAQVCNGILE